MKQVRELQMRLNEIKSQRGKLKGLTSTLDEGWEWSYFRARVALSDEITALHRLVGTLDSSTDTDIATEFKAALETYSASARRHQQSWPIILIKKEPEKFRSSLAVLDAEMSRLVDIAARLPKI